MSFTPQFLDQIRDSTNLSALIGQSIKIEKAGREHRACCPFHVEKTPSFTINDDKGFYHCFGCGVHGDAIRWLVDHKGLGFVDAVKQLADQAGLQVPAPSPQAQEREQRITDMAGVLARAAEWYGKALESDRAAQALLTARGIDSAAIARFGLGFSPRNRSIGSCGVPPARLVDAGVMIEVENGFLDRFAQRIVVPIHDARGRVIGFGGRATIERQDAKWINSAEGPHFDKGRTLYNLHRAAPAARATRRLILVEGYFDVIALDQAGIAEVVAPMGTAITEAQLERAWRVHHCPILLMDGDRAGRAAALRACERAMPMLGPGAGLRIAMLPDGSDPDDLVRGEGGREAIEAVLAAAVPLVDHVWACLLEQTDVARPEARSGLWRQLAELAGQIRDPDTRAQYLADWRARFDLRFPPAPPGLSENDMLPVGRVATVSDLGAGVAASLQRAAEAWLGHDRAGMSPQALNRFAWGLGRRVAAGLIGDDAAAEAIDTAKAKCDGASDDDVAKAFEAGKRKGYDFEPDLLDLKCAGFERTDMGNAERFHARFGRDFLYTTAKGWLGYDGRRYRVLNQEKDATPAEVLAAVMQTVRGIQDEARMIAATGVRVDDLVAADGALDRVIETGKKKELLSALIAKWGRASESSGRINCIAHLAKRWLTVEITAFDTDPMLFNCHNGTLVFHRPDGERSAWVELREHRREDLLTKLAACDYDPDAVAPEFQKLVRWAQPKSERRRYLRQWAGYNLTGDMGEQIFHIWWGPTAANGKSTVGNALREAAGDYGDITNVETFLDEGPKKRGDQATPDIVRLPGVRFLTSGEPAKGSKFNEALINSVTGGDPMLARDNFRSFFRFAPTFKWTVWCNAKPDIPMGTEGIWRRVKVLLWESHLEPHERDRTLGDRLKREYPGILAWMVRGLIDWMDHGFVEPEDVTIESAAYRDDSDPLAMFLRMCTVEDPQGRIQSSHLHALFCAWARAAGEVEWKQKGLTKAMKDRGFDNKQSNGMQWIGLKAIKTVDDFVDSDGNVKTIEVELAPDPPPRPRAADDDGVGRAYARDGPARPPDDFDPGPDDGWAL